MSMSQDDAAKRAITTPVMSANADPVDDLTVSIRSLSFPQEGDNNSPLPSPPRSPSKKSKASNSKNGPGKQHRVEAIASVLLTPPTTPQKKSEKLGNEKQLDKIPDFATLSVGLGLDSWKCGYLTPTGQPCKIRIPKKNRFEIELQIRSMVLLNQSSTELKSELLKLANLVHCKDHNEYDDKHDRTEAWMAKFPMKSDNSYEDNKKREELLVELYIREILGGVVAHCADDKNSRGPGKEDCKPRGGQRVQNCTKTLDKIVKPEVYLNDASLDYHLRVLERNSYCDSHLGDQHYGLVASWKSRILDRVKTSSLGIPKKLQFYTISEDPTTFWPKAFDSSSFVPLRRLYKQQDLEGLIKSKVEKGLNSTEVKYGYVYVMTDKANEGYVKIGYTLETSIKRAEQLRWSCNRDITVHYAPTSKIAHPRHVEALYHAELYQSRIEFYCHGCLKNHTEWFKISVEEAVFTVKKWSALVEETSYPS